MNSIDMTTLLFLVFMTLSFIYYIWIGNKAKKKINNSTDKEVYKTFYFANGQVDGKGFFSTLAGSLTGLANIIFVFSIWGLLYGPGIVIWVWLFWVIGLVFFFVILKNQNDYFLKNYTFHQFIGEKFKSEGVRRISALISAYSFLIVIAFEIIIGAKVLSIFFDWNITIELIAIAGIAFVIALYTSFGGFQAVVDTDKFQVILMGIAFLILLFVLVFKSEADFTLIITDVFSTFNNEYFFIILSIISWSIWFPITMDQWQRCSSVSGGLTEVNRWPLIGALAWFLMITIVAVMIGSLANDNSNAPMIDYLYTFVGSTDVISVIVLVIVPVAFIGAIISTVDAFISSASLCIHNDIKLSYESKNIISETNQKQNIHKVRKWIVIGTLMCIVLFWSLRLLEIPFDALFYLGWVSQMTLFPILLISIYWKKIVDVSAALISIIFGAIFAIVSCGYAAYQLMLGSGIIEGTVNNQIVEEGYYLLYLSPILTVIITSIIYLLVYIYKRLTD